MAPNRPNPESPSHRANTICAYHSGAVRHDTEGCWTLKRVVEDLIEVKAIVLRDEDAPKMTNNPLTTHTSGPVVGMICEDEEFDPELKAIAVIDEIEEKQKNSHQT